MNTQYAKEKINKLMALATNSGATKDEAATAFEMAKKIAEKYGVNAWFYKVHCNVTKAPEQNVINAYTFSKDNGYKWTGILNWIFINYSYINKTVCGFCKKSKKGNYSYFTAKMTEEEKANFDRFYKEMIKLYKKLQKQYKENLGTSKQFNNFFRMAITDAYLGCVFDDEFKEVSIAASNYFNWAKEAM